MRTRGVKMRSWIKVVAVGLLAQVVSAYDFLGDWVQDNTTYFNTSLMDAGSAAQWNGDLSAAWRAPYEAALGSWFYFGLAVSPALSMWFNNRSPHLAAMWLITVLVAYSSMINEGPTYLLYFFVVGWVASLLIKLLATKWSG
jgi:hypothetical protein